MIVEWGLSLESEELPGASVKKSGQIQQRSKQVRLGKVSLDLSKVRCFEYGANLSR